jgi:hypothetical protein
MREGTKSEHENIKKEEDSLSSTKQSLINPVKSIVIIIYCTFLNVNRKLNKNILATTKLLIKEMSEERLLKKYAVIKLFFCFLLSNQIILLYFILLMHTGIRIFSQIGSNIKSKLKIKNFSHQFCYTSYTTVFIYRNKNDRSIFKLFRCCNRSVALP